MKDLVNDVGLLRPGRRLERHGLGDGIELVALLAFENRSFELLFRSHGTPLSEGHRPLGMSARGEGISGRRRELRVNSLPRDHLCVMLSRDRLYPRRALLSAQGMLLL